MNRSLIIMVAAVSVLVVLMRANPTFVSAASPANADMLRQMEVEFMKAAADRGSQGYLSYYADNALELPNGANAIQGKINIAKTMGFLDDKNNHLSWTAIGADISDSGDLGYTHGTFEFRGVGKDGKPVLQHGKYTSIWKKQKDGNWKVVLDMGNASPEGAEVASSFQTRRTTF